MRFSQASRAARTPLSWKRAEELHRYAGYTVRDLALDYGGTFFDVNSRTSRARHSLCFSFICHKGNVAPCEIILIAVICVNK